MNTPTTYFIHDGELLCTANGITTVFMARTLNLTPRQLRTWRDAQNLRARAVQSGRHQPQCNMTRHPNGSTSRYCTCRTFPRPTRRPVRRALPDVLELTPAAVRVSAASAARALDAANEEYIDLAGLQQEGSRISPAALHAVHERYRRATRLQDACDTLLDIAA